MLGISAITRSAILREEQHTRVAFASVPLVVNWVLASTSWRPLRSSLALYQVFVHNLMMEKKIDSSNSFVIPAMMKFRGIFWLSEYFIKVFL